MTGKNSYKKWSKLSKYKTEQLIKYFAEDIPASKTVNCYELKEKQLINGTIIWEKLFIGI
jgi:hypothetical protein